MNFNLNGTAYYDSSLQLKLKSSFSQYSFLVKKVFKKGITKVWA